MKRLIILISLLLSTKSFSIDLKFDGLNEIGFDSIAQDFMANFVHTSVVPPVALGKTWGVEFGIVGGVTDAPGITSFSDTSAKEQAILPHAGILLSASVPGGFTGEVTFIPEFDTSNVKLDSTTLALRYDIGQHFFKSESFMMATRVHVGFNSLGYSQTINNASTANIPVNTSVLIDTSSFGVQVLSGFDLYVLQPYLGLGYVSGSASFTVEGSASIFDQSLTTGSTAETSSGSFHFIVGTQIDLFFIHLGVEHQSLFGASKTSGKVSFAF